MDPLWEIINSAIQRIPKLDSLNGGGLGGANVDPSQLVEEFVGPLRMLGNVIKYGIVVFNSEKKIAYINGHFEEISGIRADAAIGNDIGDVARDQSMGPFISDLFGRVSVGGEGSGEDYDFSGISHKVYLAAFGAPGGVAKCYVLLAAKVEG